MHLEKAALSLIVAALPLLVSAAAGLAPVLVSPEADTLSRMVAALPLLVPAAAPGLPALLVTGRRN